MNTLWSQLDDESCPCRGGGWALIKNEWKQCFLHYKGNLHPECQALLQDDPEKWWEEERRSHLRWRAEKARNKIKELEQQLSKFHLELYKVEAELVNRNPTIKMAAVKG